MICSTIPALSITIVLLGFQEQYPAEDHSWLRFKPGTWIKNKVIVKANDTTRKSFQNLTFKGKSDKDYTIEEIETVEGEDKAPSIRRSSLGSIIAKETLTLDSKEYPCSISTATTHSPDGEWETKYWMPKGNKYPLKVVLKQPGLVGELTAVALDEKLTVCGREYSCAKLRGKVKLGELNGTVTVWLTQSPSNPSPFISTAEKADFRNGPLKCF